MQPGQKFSRAAATVALSLWLCAPTHAQWARNGVPITTAFNFQDEPRITPDEAGGAIVVWRDGRDYFTNNIDIYARRVASDGTNPPGWLPHGVPVCTDTMYQDQPGILSDGTGGAYIVWIDRRDPVTGVDVYVQRLTADGAVSPGWPVNAIAACRAPGFQNIPKLAPDGAGGVFVVWEDYRRDGLNPEIYAQRVTPQGEIAPGWAVNGLPVCTTPGGCGLPNALSDGAGGLFVEWADARNLAATLADIYAQRILADGSVAPGWPVDGVPVCTAPGYQNYGAVAPDGEGGFYVTWTDTRFAPLDAFPDDYFDIFAQRVTAGGSIAPGWPADGLPVCTAYGPQYNHAMVADGRGGAIVAWADYRDYSLNASDLYAQRLLPSGQVAWMVDGVPLSRDPRFQHYPSLVADGAGGALVSFQTGADANYVFAQHVMADGAIAPAWDPDGMPLCDFVGQNLPVATTDGRNGMIVAWEDERGGIYAQQVPGDYPTPTLVTLASVDVEPGRVRLTWFAGSTVAHSAQVYRREGVDGWHALGSPDADGRDRLMFEDRAVVAGRYAYRLGYATGAGEAFTPETWVTVPSGPVLAMAGFHPNPALGTPVVSLSLPSGEDALLQAFDATGRVVADTRVGSLGPGRHVVPLGGARWAPGMYWLRLTQGRRTLTAKGLVTR